MAFAAVGNSNHCGALAWYLRQTIDAGMIGIVSTNALPTMAPFGGADRIVGMNPLGIGIPAGREPDFVIDAAFAACARGKVVVYGQKGLDLPSGCERGLCKACVCPKRAGSTATGELVQDEPERITLCNTFPRSAVDLDA